MAQKIIRTHKERVAKAKEIVEKNSIYSGASLLDREAIVGFLLLEDVRDLYSKRLEDAKSHVPVGRIAAKARDLNIKKFSGVIEILSEAIGTARSTLEAGNYKKVRRAINEGSLISAANSIKNIDEMLELAMELVKDISDDALYVERFTNKIGEFLEDLEMHEDNVRTARDISSAGNGIDAAIASVQDIIPTDETNKKTNKKGLIDTNPN